MQEQKKKNFSNLIFIIQEIFLKNSYHKVDDYKIGGGAGLLMQAEPMYEVLRSIQEKKENPYFIFLNPSGKTLIKKTPNA